MKLESLNHLLKEENGYSENEIVDTEKRLKIKFPRELRLVYLNYGKNKILNSCDYLTPLNALKVHKEKVFFFTENQGSFVWFFKVEETEKNIIKPAKKN